LKQLALGPGFAHFKASLKTKYFLINEEEKLKDYPQKLFIEFFVRNLLPAEWFSILLENLVAARLKIF